MKIIKSIVRFFSGFFSSGDPKLDTKKQLEDIMIHSMSLEARVRSLSILVNKQSQLLADIAKVQSELAIAVYGPSTIESLLGSDLEMFEIESEDFKLDGSTPLILINTDDDDDLIN